MPTPTKEHLQYMAPQCASPGSLPQRALRTILWCQLRLSCAHKLHRLNRRLGFLQGLQQLPKNKQPTHVQQFDSTGKSKWTQALYRVSAWLGYTLAHTLQTQGPGCAVLAMKVPFPLSSMWQSHFEADRNMV